MTASEGQTRLRLLRKHLSRALKRFRFKLEKQQTEFKETERAGWYRQIADSLLANPTGEGLPRGLSKVAIVNIHTQNEEPVALNPKLDFRKNAELFYKKARKGQRGAAINRKKIAETEAGIKTGEQLIHEADTALSAGSEEQIYLELCGRIESTFGSFLPHALAAAVPAAENITDKIPYRHFTLDGWDLYTGKNDAQNDEMTTRFARPHDLWLHVAGHAGSHVIIRRPDRTTVVPQEIIKKAASLAVWFSKAKHTSYAEVHVTDARFVHKRRHAPAGEVIAERCKSVRVSPCSPEDLFPSKYDDASP
jgi:predicted ribosome quality control (RQC) complex YloA/Tae2 family protein